MESRETVIDILPNLGFTVAHICHGKTYFSTAKVTFPRQNLLFHGKTYFLTAILSFSRQNLLFYGPGPGLWYWRLFNLCLFLSWQPSESNSRSNSPVPELSFLPAPYRAKEESRITCMRMLKTSQSKIISSQPRCSRQCVALSQLALWKKTFSLT